MVSGYVNRNAVPDSTGAASLGAVALVPWSGQDEAQTQFRVFPRPVPSLLVLGTRGIPARHGGFETFAQQLSLFLAERGWDASVYCQAEASEIGPAIAEENWQGVRQIHVPSRDGGSLASIMYDLRCILDARRRPGPILLLGYNTAAFVVLLRLLRKTIIINMDGLEWQRPKWSRAARLWLWINERIAARLGHVLVADHPQIRNHLAGIARPDKLVMIPYGAPEITEAPVEPILKLGLAPRGYYVCISRIEPENSQLAIVEAFSAAPRDKTLYVLGKIDERNAYHRAVRAAASENVMFPGPIYDEATLASLRVHAGAYCHGHTVGGTNPSLVEALGAGCAVIAHDNPFNRWTAGSGQFFFQDTASCKELFDFVGDNPDVLDRARESARARHRSRFVLDDVLMQYERVIAFDWQMYCEAIASPAYGRESRGGEAEALMHRQAEIVG